MNFFDTYDVPGSTTPTPQREESLNEEVTQVVGQLGRFWGDFRKQSQSVLETARKDFSQAVSHAQREINKLTSGDPTLAPTETEASLTNTGPAASTITATDQDTTHQLPDHLSGDDQSELDSTASTSTLLSRLQSALPPNLLEVARNQIPESLKHVSENIDLPQLRNSFMSEYQRVQGVTRVQAEEYAHKTEALFREAVKEASEVLRDAVKILPPEESTTESASGLVWDGSDMWSLPLESPDTIPQSHPPAINAATTGDRKTDALASRAESLLRRLRLDPEIIKHDPAVDSGEAYSTWLSAKVTSKDGGIQGDDWSTKIASVLDQTGSGDMIKTTRDILVPSEMTEKEFWARYFFRVHQIESEERRRKALLEGTVEEDDFSWEDDEDDSGGANLPITSAPAAGTDTPRQVESKPPQPLSSGEDYDVISSGNASPKDHDEHKAGKKAESDADSDWE